MNRIMMERIIEMSSLDEQRRKRCEWCAGDADTPLAVLEEQSSKQDRYQFTQVSWAVSAFSLNLVCSLLGLSKENFFLPMVSRLTLSWAKIPDYVMDITLCPSFT